MSKSSFYNSNPSVETIELGGDAITAALALLAKVNAALDAAEALEDAVNEDRDAVEQAREAAEAARAQALEAAANAQATAAGVASVLIRSNGQVVGGGTIPAPDTTPNPFTFPTVANALVSSVYTSAQVTILGINTATPISITGGTYNINGGSYTSSAGTVMSGDVVTVQLISSPDNQTSKSATLTVGGLTASFIVTTKAVETGTDTTPNQFFFEDFTDIAPNTAITSAPATITGIDAPAPITVTGGSYCINEGTFTTAPGTITNGSTIRVRVQSASTPQTARTVQVNVGGILASFRAITAEGEVANDETPNSFTFNPITEANLNSVYTSNTITVSGINVPVELIMYGYGAGAEPETSRNGEAFQAGDRFVNNGDTITLRWVSGSTASQTKTVNVSIGTVDRSWTITTAAETTSSGINVPSFETGPWKITMPYDSAGRTYATSSTVGTAVEVWPPALADIDNQYLDVQTDGSLIFAAPVDGARTSGSSYSRAELREILDDASNEYEWTPATGGRLEATCAVLEMPTLTTGTTNRVIIGQIHGPNDEPCRLYYYSDGSIRFRDDKAGSSQVETEFILRDSSNAQTSIPLGGFFTYVIEMDGSGVKVTVTRNGVKYTALSPLSTFWPGKAMYFKAGAYNAVGITTGTSSNRGTGQSRVHFKRLINPVHPHTISASSGNSTEGN